jgi:hypothetical protein
MVLPSGTGTVLTVTGGDDAVGLRAIEFFEMGFCSWLEASGRLTGANASEAVISGAAVVALGAGGRAVAAIGVMPIGSLSSPAHFTAADGSTGFGFVPSGALIRTKSREPPGSSSFAAIREDAGIGCSLVAVDAAASGAEARLVATSGGTVKAAASPGDHFGSAWGVMRVPAVCGASKRISSGGNFDWVWLVAICGEPGIGFSTGTADAAASAGDPAVGRGAAINGRVTASGVTPCATCAARGSRGLSLGGASARTNSGGVCAESFIGI